jgi:hypothetical protein
VAQEYRYMPPVAEMIRMAHEGAVGRIHQVAIREHREPFYPKVGDWNRFSANTGGTLVEKCCHYFNLMDLILGERPTRVFASGGQRVNHLDESYGGRRPDILDSAYVIVEYPSGARAMLDLCMFAENSVDNEHIVVVGDEGKLESLLPSLTCCAMAGARTGAGARSGASPRAPAAACRCGASGTPRSATPATISAPRTSSISVRAGPDAKAGRPRSASKKACAAWPPAWQRIAASSSVAWSIWTSFFRRSWADECGGRTGRGLHALPQPAGPRGLHLRRQLGHRRRAGARLCRAGFARRLLRHPRRRRRRAHRRVLQRRRPRGALVRRGLRRARRGRLPGAAGRGGRAPGPIRVLVNNAGRDDRHRWRR